jgi:hypothetical protein
MPAINVFQSEEDDSYNPNKFHGEMEAKLRFNLHIRQSDMEGDQRNAPLLGGMQSSAFDRRD